MYAVGIMSGTSLDGVDVILVDIEGTGIATEIDIIEFETFEIPNELIKEIKLACDKDRSSVDIICSLNFKLGKLFADSVKKICEKASIEVSELKFIGSHGQTIYHIPKEETRLVKSTLQIGEPAVIAYETKTTVVSNFRVMDMAAGGQGAPLVPFSEKILYSKFVDRGIALQNIGGIGNVTVIDKINDEIFAFDTGPGNMIINEACEILYGRSFDKDGEIAKLGEIKEELLDYLMNHDYIKKNLPKTTGREEFGEDFTLSLLERFIHLNKEDIIATITMFTAKSIGYGYKKFVLNKVNLDKVVLSGGGVHNQTLVKFIKEELKEIEVVTQEELGYDSDGKEALAFVILANETLHRNTSNVIGATHAKEKVILGNITLI